jgi:hypothetical protein
LMLLVTASVNLRCHSKNKVCCFGAG